MREPRGYTFGTGYFPSRTASGTIVFVGVAGVEGCVVRALAQEIYQRMDSVLHSEHLTAEGACLLIEDRYPGHAYWLEVEGEDEGYQHYAPGLE